MDDASHKPFIDAEEAAVKLLNNLGRLRAETENYGTATARLDETHRALTGLIEAVQHVAVGALEATRKVREVGTPQLMEGLDRLGGSVDGVVAESKAAIQAAHGVSLAVDGLRAAVDAQARRIEASVQESARGVGDKITTTSIRQVQELRSSSEARAAEIGKGVIAMGERLLMAVSTETARVRKWAFIATILAALAFTGSAVVLLWAWGIVTLPK